MKNKSNKTKLVVIAVLIVGIVGFMVAPTFAQHSVTMDSFFGNIFGIFTPQKDPFSPEKAILWLDEQIKTEDTVANGYFAPRKRGESLDSTGRNFAPSINTSMHEDDDLNMTNDILYGWRIWKGTQSEGYNIFWTTDDLPGKKVGDSIPVIKYNTVGKKFIYGTGKVSSKTVEGVTFNIIDGGSFVEKGNDQNDTSVEIYKKAVALSEKYNGCKTYEEKRALLGLTSGAAGNDQMREYFVKTNYNMAMPKMDETVLSKTIYQQKTEGLFYQVYFTNSGSGVPLLYASVNKDASGSNIWGTNLVYNGSKWYEYIVLHEYNGKITSCNMASLFGAKSTMEEVNKILSDETKFWEVGKAKESAADIDPNDAQANAKAIFESFSKFWKDEKELSGSTTRKLGTRCADTIGTGTFVNCEGGNTKSSSGVEGYQIWNDFLKYYGKGISASEIKIYLSDKDENAMRSEVVSVYYKKGSNSYTYSSKYNIQKGVI